VALSLKQPWAALVVSGLKTIEIRRWRATRRGRILIHASGSADNRPEAWKHVTDEIAPLAKLRGGILGAVELTDCLDYRTPQAFEADQSRHLNEPDWYLKPVLYGFVFADPKKLAFQRVSGWVRFFSVAEYKDVS
jgi:hypothetical protein